MKKFKIKIHCSKGITNGRDPVDGFEFKIQNFQRLQIQILISKLLQHQIMRLIVILGLYHKRVLLAHSTLTIRSDKPHNVKAGDQIIVKNIQSSTNSTGLDGKGYNGTFIVDSIINDKEFKYSNTDVRILHIQ